MKITLTSLYEFINKALKGSKIPNDEVTIIARVKLPDDQRIVELKVTGVSTVITDIPQEERDKMDGMYPPTRRAAISIDCETIKE